MGKSTWIFLVLAGLVVILLLFSFQQGELAELRQQVALLETEVADLSARVEVGDHPPVPLPGPAASAASLAGSTAAPTPSHMDAARTQGGTTATAELGDRSPARPRMLGESELGRQLPLRALVSELEQADSPLRGEFRKLVREEQDAIWDGFRERRQAAWERRTTERLEQLAGDVQLTPEQVDTLYGSLTAARDRIGEVFRKARETQRFDGAHDEAARIHAETDAEARDLLSDEQYEAYEKMREDQRRERRRRHRRMRAPEPSEAE